MMSTMMENHVDNHSGDSTDNMVMVVA